MVTWGPEWGRSPCKTLKGFMQRAPKVFFFTENNCTRLVAEREKKKFEGRKRLWQWFQNSCQGGSLWGPNKSKLNLIWTATVMGGRVVLCDFPLLHHRHMEIQMWVKSVTKQRWTAHVMLTLSCIMSSLRTVTWECVRIPAVCSMVRFKSCWLRFKYLWRCECCCLGHVDWLKGCVFLSFWPKLTTHTHTHNGIIWEWKSVEKKGSRALGWRKVELVSCWSKPVARGDVGHRRQCCKCTAWWDLCPHNNLSAILH